MHQLGNLSTVLVFESDVSYCDNNNLLSQWLATSDAALGKRSADGEKEEGQNTD